MEAVRAETAAAQEALDAERAAKFAAAEDARELQRALETADANLATERCAPQS